MSNTARPYRSYYTFRFDYDSRYPDVNFRVERARRRVEDIDDGLARYRLALGIADPSNHSAIQPPGPGEENGLTALWRYLGGIEHFDWHRLDARRFIDILCNYARVEVTTVVNYLTLTRNIHVTGEEYIGREAVARLLYGDDPACHPSDAVQPSRLAEIESTEFCVTASEKPEEVESLHELPRVLRLRKALRT